MTVHKIFHLPFETHHVSGIFYQNSFNVTEALELKPSRSRIFVDDCNALPSVRPSITDSYLQGEMSWVVRPMATFKLGNDAVLHSRPVQSREYFRVNTPCLMVYLKVFLHVFALYDSSNEKFK